MINIHEKRFYVSMWFVQKIVEVDFEVSQECPAYRIWPVI